MDFERVQFEKDMKRIFGRTKEKSLDSEKVYVNGLIYMYGTNHSNFIDVYSRMQIEQLIEKFFTDNALVEHDMAFRDAVATKSD